MYHHLRHTYASLLGDAGLSALQIAARLGHANTRQSEAYVHPYLDPEEGQATRDAIDHAFGIGPAQGPATPVNIAPTLETTSDVHGSAENVDFVD